MNQEFIAIIKEDIKKGYEITNAHDISQCNEFHARILSKYAPIIDGFDKNLRSLSYDNDKRCCLANIKTMVEKLELFSAMGYKNVFSQLNPDMVINNTNNNNNSNVINIEVTFDMAKKRVEEMSALTEEEIEGVLKKISELETIVNSNDRRTRKWENAKGIIKWIAEKGVDVGLTILPLLLKIKE